MCWKGYTSNLETFIGETIANLTKMKTARAKELEPMFNAAKAWLMRDW